jgi:hypothetical protein
MIGVRVPQGLGIFLFTTAYRPALVPTLPPIQWVRGALPLGVMWLGCEADHLPPSSAEVKECVELNLHSPNKPTWRGALLKHRDNFAFTFNDFSTSTVVISDWSMEPKGIWAFPFCKQWKAKRNSSMKSETSDGTLWCSPPRSLGWRNYNKNNDDINRNESVPTRIPIFIYPTTKESSYSSNSLYFVFVRTGSNIKQTYLYSAPQKDWRPYCVLPSVVHVICVPSTATGRV